MLLIISLVLAFVPLLGIVSILVKGSMTTVDGLFMSLILLAISGVFGLNGLWEFQRLRRRAVDAAVLEGDLRNRLPAGKKAELIFRDENGVKTLVSADYA